MDRIADAFSIAANERRSCFLSYVCAGDPSFEGSLRICKFLAESPVDIMEIGVPFSDPLADGLTNQLAAQRALDGGADHSHVFELIRLLRKQTEKPIVIYTYYNLIFAKGIEEYVRVAKDAGVDGILTLDLPPEEAKDLLVACRDVDLKNIFIVAPTTPKNRIRLIAEAASGFIYYVSREGVTGEREKLSGNIGRAVAEIKEISDLPVAVGCGISTPDHVRTISEVADGFVVGSALVNCISSDPSDPNQILGNLSKKLAYLLEN